MKQMNFNEYCRSVIDRYPEYVTQKEMCAILGICVSTAYDYVSTSEDRRQRITVTDILLYQYKKINELENEYTKDFGQI
ncbi:hypothetical protein [Dehalobacter sp. TBBPA1]|uniref:hypothetical protein n=1 Tax=Dehalobacter sp. TBBPA1 TaxID=3235037 RepID=UPI0034A28ED5